MDEQFIIDTLTTLDARTTRIEQVLPSLATKDFVRTAIADAIAPLATKQELADAIAPLATKQELADAIAPLATKQELAAAIAPLATRVEMRQYFDETRRHFEVIAEGLRGDMRVLAEGIIDLKSDVGELRRITSRHEEMLLGLQLEVGDLRRDVRQLQDQRR
jgi:putative component of toxin-antitoxin plasmid stabilization module